jgi:hypothetical protein
MNTIEIIVSVALIAFIQGWIILYFTYFKEKGKYQAMKEEIDEITQTQESIKNNLAVIAQTQISLNTERRKAILKYYNDLNRIRHYLVVELSIDKNDYENFMPKLYEPYSRSRSNLQLFIEDENILNIVEGITDLIVYNFSTASNYANEYAAASKLKDNKSKLDELDKKFDDLFNKSFEEFDEEQKKLINLLRELLKKDLT